MISCSTSYLAGMIENYRAHGTALDKGAARVLTEGITQRDEEATELRKSTADLRRKIIWMAGANVMLFVFLLLDLLRVLW